MKTFAEFLASAAPCDDLRVPFPDLAVECDDPRPGVIFDGDMYVERASDGVYSVDLYNSGAVGTLEECAAALYGWAITECPDEMGVTAEHDGETYGPALATYNVPGMTDTLADFVSECGGLVMQRFGWPDIDTAGWEAIERAALAAGRTFAEDR